MSPGAAIVTDVTVACLLPCGAMPCAGGRSGAPMRGESGMTMLDVVVAAGLVSLLAVVGVPVLAQAASDARAQNAARYLAMKVMVARLEAVRRGTHVALRFEPDAAGFRFTTYVDGNANGVRASDIASGADHALAASDALRDHFGDADLRVAFSVPGIDGGPALVMGGDPVRLGASTLLSWSPRGSSTSGTLYVAGPRGPQWAVRVFGATGRVRVLRFDPGAGQWRPH
jgi:type II secretory pathway pseudopilin PulG